MLKINQVKKNYKDFQLDATLCIKPGSITGLIGPNGAGKTTLYKAILGLIKTDGGEICLFGKDLKDMTAEDKQNIGVALNESGYSGYITVQDVKKIMNAFYPNFDSRFFEEKIKEADLPLKKKIKEFSTGMKAKLKVICAMSYRAKFLILDEPTAGLDVIARDEVLDLLREYIAEDEERSILISSHISSDLESICDDLYLINKGKVVYHEDTDRILSDYGLIKVSSEDFQVLDKTHVLRYKEEKFGISALTNSRSYYNEQYPDLVIEKGNVDELITLMIRGEVL